LLGILIECVINNIKLDAMLEEEMIDLLTFCIQNDPDAKKNPEKKLRVHDIGKELFADGGVDAMENMYFAIEQRITEEIKKDPKPYRAWWNNIASTWKY
jgi:hypothetical protein